MEGGHSENQRRKNIGGCERKSVSWKVMLMRIQMMFRFSNGPTQVGPAQKGGQLKNLAITGLVQLVLQVMGFLQKFFYIF